MPWEAPRGPGGSALLLWLSSGDGDCWVSTGLYLPGGRSAEVSLSEAAACAGLKVRPRAARFPSAPSSVPGSPGREDCARFTDCIDEAARFRPKGATETPELLSGLGRKPKPLHFHVWRLYVPPGAPWQPPNLTHLAHCTRPSCVLGRCLDPRGHAH